MLVLMITLSVACFVGALVSFLRYDSKHFDLLILCGVILMSSAAPSFEVDTSIDELRSINHRLLDLQASIEKTRKP
jgi:hypothetical protein